MTTTTISTKEIKKAILAQLNDEKQMGANEAQLNHLTNVMSDLCYKLTGDSSLV